MIFVSYAWIDGKPDEEVTNLVAQLRKRGYEVSCDVILAEERTAIDFNRMMKENMHKSKKIIVVLSEEYKKKADSFEGGVGVEYKYILEDIDIHIRKYILISFKTDINNIEIPDALRGREIICLGKDFDRLYYKLDDIPEYEFPEVNKRKNIVSSKKVYGENSAQSRTQEYADKWNANMFLNDFSKWDENPGVAVRLKDVYIEGHLPHFIWGSNCKKSTNMQNLLADYINKNEKKQMLLILGQPGIGKSTLITWITANYTANLEDILVYQFASDLKNIDWKNTSEKYNIADDLLVNLNLSKNDLDGKTLIIDGFDEINVENREEILNKFFWQFIKEKSFFSFSFIITCRENYIHNLQKIQCDYITLQAWDKEQIISFCRTYQNITYSNISKDTIINILKNKEILGIPLILYMVLALNINIDKEKTIVDIYDKIFSLDGGIYDRCIENKSFDEKHRTSDIKKQIHQISREIAVWMFENNPNEAYITQSEYQKICIDVMKKYGQKKINKDFLIGNYFKLVKHCEGIETETLYFVHRTIYEYFVSETIYNSIENTMIVLTDKSQEEFAGNIAQYLIKGEITYTIGGYIERKIKKLYFQLEKNKQKIFYQWWEEAVSKMMKYGMLYYVKDSKKSYMNAIEKEILCFTNLIEILRSLVFETSEKSYVMENVNRSILESYIKHSIIHYQINKKQNKIFDLADLSLKNIDLSWMDLSGVNFAGADLTETNLTGANLIRAGLTGMILVRTNVEKAIISENQANYFAKEFKECNLQEVRIYNEKTNEFKTYEQFILSIQ